MSPLDLWRFLPLGYLFTIAIETPILLIGLSPHHSKLRRLAAGIWLNASTYSIVLILLSLLMENGSPGGEMRPTPSPHPFVIVVFVCWIKTSSVGGRVSSGEFRPPIGDPVRE